MLMRFVYAILIALILVGCAAEKERIVEEKALPEETETVAITESEAVKEISLKVESVFSNGGKIPSKYTCDGADVSPPLQINGISGEAKTIALIVDDPDAPAGVFTHWVIWNIPAEKIVSIPENLPKSPEIDEPVIALQGKNNFGKIGYNGPCPPSGEHRYFFKVYVLDTELNLNPGITKDELLKAIEGHVIQYAELYGVYSR